MKKIILFISVSLFGYIGWWCGAAIGGIMTAYLLSLVGSLVGVILGVRINRRYLG
jgi:TM2 domain-containing membrane protein YozV